MARPAPDQLPDLTHYRDAYLVCRTVGHRWPNPEGWHWSQVVGPRGRVLSYRRRMTCTRCHVLGTDVIDARTGDKSPRTYRHPDDYLRPLGHGFDRGEMRLEQIRRVVGRGTTMELIEVDGLDAPEVPVEDHAELEPAGPGVMAHSLSHAQDGRL